MSAQTDFQIVKVTEQDSDKVLQYLRKYFYTEEPLNQFLNRQRNETVVPSNRGLNAAKAIQGGLCIMAVTPSNQVVGVAINKHVTKEDGRETRIVEDHPNFIQIAKFLVELEAQSADLVKLRSENEKEMSIAMVSVHPEWRSKGIGMALLQRSVNIAKQDGFSQIQGICTSAYSARMFEQFGFQCAYVMKYEDYKEDGKIIFKPDVPHTEVKIMVFRV